MSNAQIIYDMPEEEYHASSGIGEGLWITRSVLSCYDHDPRGCWLRYVDKHPLAQFNGNDGTDLGTVFDMLVTGESDKLAVGGPINEKTGKIYGRDTKKFSEWKAECVKGGLTPCSESEMQLAQLLMREAQQSKHMRYMLGCPDRKHQVVVRWHDDETGLPLQVRIDTVLPTFLTDVKTGRHHPSKFVTSASSFGYDMQAVMYPDGYERATGNALPFAFAYFQTTFPFTCMPIVLPRQLIESARIRYRKALQGVAANNWGDPINEPLVPDIPAWWWHQYETEEGE